MYVATYSYFFLSLIGYQQLNSEPEMFFPVFLVLKFVFFIGWLKVGSFCDNLTAFPLPDTGSRGYQPSIWG